MSGLKLFHTTNSGVTEVTPRPAAVEADVQDLVEAHMEAMLGVTLLGEVVGVDELPRRCLASSWRLSRRAMKAVMDRPA